MKHRISHFKAYIAHPLLIAIASCFLLTVSAQAQTDETVRHTIVKDDTLWGLATQYLESPWLWPELWEQNTYIENPDLIYPDDVLIISPDSIRLIRNKRLSVNKLSPQVRATPSHAITTLNPSIIMPFLVQSIVVEPGVLDNAAYVLEGIDGKIVLGKFSRFFATGLKESDATEYLLFGKGRVLRDDVTGTVYGIESDHLGTARLIRIDGDIAELEITKANLEVYPGEYLIPIEEPSELPRYFPHRPDQQIDTRILSVPKGLDEAGRNDVVIISGGKTDGVEEGHVMEVFSHAGKIRDPKTDKFITVPDTNIGNLMVFKAYEKVSYALLMETSESVMVGDRESSP
jgi:hypothetical protein